MRLQCKCTCTCICMYNVWKERATIYMYMYNVKERVVLTLRSRESANCRSSPSSPVGVEGTMGDEGRKELIDVLGDGPLPSLGTDSYIEREGREGGRGREGEGGEGGREGGREREARVQCIGISGVG